MRSIFTATLLFLFSMSTLLAQRTISGIVTDEDGAPLIGANVAAKGTTIGTITDIDGMYSIEVPDDTELLVFSYIGYQTEEIELGVSNVLDVEMATGVTLETAIVTALGLEKNKRTVGYAIENVKQDDIKNAQEVNLINALNSKVAGVSVVSSSGSPGASANIRIRGSSSITGNNSPLFVIDGVPIDNSSFGNDVDGVDNANRVIDLNPNDIQSMSVLKGAAATATYGIRAANGVIIIETKKGRVGKTRVDVSTTISFDEVNQLPERQNEWAQGRPSGDERIWRGPETFEGFSWGPRISDLEYDGDDSYAYDRNGRLVPRGQGNGMPAQAYDVYDFFKTGFTYDLNASVGGGSEKANYYISAGRTDVDGFIPNATFARNSFRINTSFAINDKVSAEASANYISSGGNRMQRGSNLRGVMLGLLRNTPTFDVGNGLTGQDAADAVSSYELPDGTQRSYRAGIYDNPYWVVNRNLTEDDVRRVIGNVGATYDVNDWLSVKYKLGIDAYNDQRLGYIDIVPNWNPGSVANRDIRSTDLNSDLLLLFNKQINDDLGFDLTVGHNFFRQRLTDRMVDGATLSQAGFYDISNASDITTDVDTRNRNLIGAFGILDVNYQDFVFGSFTFRNDWSSTLPEDNNSFESYSFNLGFAFTEIPGVDLGAVEYGKLRLSYGSVGLDAPVYATTPYFNQGIIGGDGFIDENQFPAFGVNAFELSNQLPNSSITPERTNTVEVGLEMQFLKGRLGFDLTYYDSESQDQIVPVEISAATGFTSAILNAGVVTNSGIEALLNFTPVKTSNFKLDVDVNFTAMENDVESLAEGLENIGLAGFVSTSSRAVAGQPFGAIFGNGFQRNDAGQLIIGADGFPIVDPTPQVLGNPIPDWTAGIRLTGTIMENLTISALLDLREGGDMWCGTCGIMDYFGTSARSGELRTETVVFDGVTEDGSPNTMEVGYADVSAGVNGSYFTRYGFGGITEMSLYDTSWKRLREVSVGYTLPGSITNKIGFERINITLAARNLWLDTDYPGIDPETNLEGDSNGIGLDYFNNPNTKSYTAAIRLSF